MQKIIRYRCRETGELREETVFGKRGLSLLYGNPFGRFAVNVLLRSHLPSRIYGWLQSRPGSRRKIRSFIEKLGVDSDEADRPLESYADFNAFFTRKLRLKDRPIEPNPDALLSPADGRITVYPMITGDGTLRVKCCSILLGELLQDETLAGQFRDGSAAVVRLAPADCHRFHFPDSGLASTSRSLGWGLHSVHPIALDAGARSFLNRRMVSTLETSHFGRIVLVEVGALLIGRIVQTYAPGLVHRGEEKGYFSFGGSTVIMLAARNRVTFDADLVAASQQEVETLVRYGTRIGSRLEHSCAS